MYWLSPGSGFLDFKPKTWTTIDTTKIDLILFACLVKDTTDHLKIENLEEKKSMVIAVVKIKCDFRLQKKHGVSRLQKQKSNYVVAGKAESEYLSHFAALSLRCIGIWVLLLVC